MLIINKIISFNRISVLHGPLGVSEMGRVCDGPRKLIEVRLDVLPMMRNVKKYNRGQGRWWYSLLTSSASESTRAKPSVSSAPTPVDLVINQRNLGVSKLECRSYTAYKSIRSKMKTTMGGVFHTDYVIVSYQLSNKLPPPFLLISRRRRFESALFNKTHFYLYMSILGKFPSSEKQEE